jgi:hypothetical protein
MRSAKRREASGSSTASSSVSASSASAPTGVFSSWLTLATKSRRVRGLDRHVPGGVVLARQRRHPHSHARRGTAAAWQVQLHVAAGAAAAHLTGEGADQRVHALGTQPVAQQAQGHRRRVRDHGQVLRVEDEHAHAQRGERVVRDAARFTVRPSGPAHVHPPRELSRGRRSSPPVAADARRRMGRVGRPTVAVAKLVA